MRPHKKSTITIIGAGIAGCFTAILLAKRGYNVEIYERSSQDSICNDASRRSFMLTFLGYGVNALKEAELWDRIQPYLHRLDGALTQVTKYTKPTFSRFAKDDIPYYAIKRSNLMRFLIDQANTYTNISFHFETRILSIDRHEKKILMQDLRNKKITSVQAEVLLGADGIHSIVRSALQQGQQAEHYQEYGTWSYKQIIIEKDVVQKLQLHANAMHAWTRKDAVLAAFPNDDGSYAAILMLPTEKGFSSLTSSKRITVFVEKNFPTMLPIIPTLQKGMSQSPEGSFVMIHTLPWYYKDFMAIIGDAAHGFFPFFGQGMSAALGDGLALVRLVDTYGSDWGTIFPLYQEARKKHMDALGDLSKAGAKRYTRNRIADYNVIADKLEFMLHTALPQYIQPPIFLSIANDPDHTAEYVASYNKQKKIFKALGFPLMIHVITSILLIFEKLHILITKRKIATISVKE